jgi:hypothetical protein
MSEQLNATELYERQMRYDILHHRKRVAELRAVARPDRHQRMLLRQSERVLAHPCEGYRSADLNNAAYLAELDAFAATAGVGAVEIPYPVTTVTNESNTFHFFVVTDEKGKKVRVHQRTVFTGELLEDFPNGSDSVWEAEVLPYISDVSAVNLIGMRLLEDWLPLPEREAA